MIYFIIPILLLLFGILLEYPDRRNMHNVMYGVALVILVLLAGLRGDIEPDYINYVDIFEKSGRGIRTNVEPGFYYFNALLQKLGLGFQWVIFLSAFFSLTTKLHFFRQYSANYFITIVLYYCSVYFLFDFIAIRQAIAMSIFMMTIPVILERRMLLYFLLIGIAALFHISALVLLPLYFFVDRIYPKVALYSVLALCTTINLLVIKTGFLDYLLTLVSIPGFATAKLKIYSLDNEFAALSLKQLALGFLFVFYADSLRSKNMTNALLNIYIFGLLTATLLNGIPQFAYRIKSYFLWADVLLLVELIQIIAGGRRQVKYALYIAIVLFYCFTLDSFLNTVAERSSYKDLIYPYQPFFGNPF